MYIYIYMNIYLYIYIFFLCKAPLIELLRLYWMRFGWKEDARQGPATTATTPKTTTKPAATTTTTTTTTTAKATTTTATTATTKLANSLQRIIKHINEKCVAKQRNN